MMRYVLAAAMAAILASGARAQDVSIQDAWARATSAGAKTAAVYMSITAATADKLTAVSTPVAGEASVHETYRDGDMVGMRPVDRLSVAAAKPTVLAPGGYHVMLTGLRKRLTKGASFPMTLSFEKAGRIETTVRVESAGATGSMHDMGSGHDMDHMPGMDHRM